MTLRIMLLRVMLWSLAISAATGVLAVLFQGGDLVWRVVGTGFTTAFACGLLLPVSNLVDREKSRPAGLLGMGAVIVEFLMAMAMIWEIPRNLWGVSWEEEIAGTMMLFGIAVVLIVCFLKMLHEPYGAVAGRVGAFVTLATFIACMIAYWLPRRIFEKKWWETSGALAVFGGLAVLGLINLGTGDRRHWRWAGIVASVVACAMWLIDIWIGTGSDLGFVIFCCLIGLAVVVGHANISLLCSLTPGQHWVRGGTIAAVVLTACMIDLIVADERSMGIGIDQDLLGRFAAAGGIAAACGTLALAVLARMNRKVDFEPVSLELNEMTVVCPRCQKKQPIRIGDSACMACKLRISIRIEEPRCPQCDYLLYRLTSDRCPECGTVLGDGRLHLEYGKSPIPELCGTGILPLFSRAGSPCHT